MIKKNESKTPILFAKQKQNKTTLRTFWKAIKKVFLGLILLFVLTTSASGIWIYWYFSMDLPSIDTLFKQYQPKELSRIYDKHGEVIGEFFLHRREVVPLEQIPDHLINAFVAAEDQKFFVHKGVDLSSILRAFLKNLDEGRVVQGGSTITQQAVKMIVQDNSRTIARKIREAILAYRIERELSKSDIINLYLNQIYLGHGAYGVQSASESYFGKDVSALSLAEATLLAGIVPAPSRYSPYTRFELAKERQTYVLDQMIKGGFISPEEAKSAYHEPIHIIESPRINTFQAPYFVEHVRRSVQERHGFRPLYEGGLRIYTTLDLNLQRAAQQAIRNGLKTVDRRQGFRGVEGHMAKEEIPAFRERTSLELYQSLPSDAGLPLLNQGRVYRAVVTDLNYGVNVGIGPFTATLRMEDIIWASQGYKLDPIKHPPTQFKVGDIIRVEIVDAKKGIVSLYQEPKVEGALFAYDLSTGYVMAMVGGYDFNRSQFNRVTQARRQPGSSFKPIIYSASMDKGFTEFSVIRDAPIAFPLPGGRVWQPQNHGGKYYGPQILRNALARSLNTVSVRLLDRIGLTYLIDYAHRLGISSHFPENLSIALGATEITPFELIRAYSAFASGGRLIEPVFAPLIMDRSGKIIEDRRYLNSPDNLIQNPKTIAISQQNNFSMPMESYIPAGYVIPPETAYIMTDMLQNVVANGTGRRAQVLGRTVAGKTGTTNESRDTWFIGFTPNMICGVWVGFDGPKSLGKGEEGSRTALPIWIDFMQKALEGQPDANFEVPHGIVFARHPDVPTQFIPFKRGTVPDSLSFGSVEMASLEQEEPFASAFE